MVLFPNCKINLGLSVLRKRTDGYHDIETVFYPIPVCDALEVVRAQQASSNFQFSGIRIPDDPTKNLCLRAYDLLKEDHPHLPAVDVFLHKGIPIGAGLGGGSADGAFMLKLLNSMFNLRLDQQQLLNYALQLGSDAPFFIHPTPSFATGRGEALESIALDLSTYHLVIVNPGIHVNTAHAFSMLTPGLPPLAVREVISTPVSQWKDRLTNDFEIPVFEMHPLLREIRDSLYTQGAVYAAMSGSGSTIFGIFDRTELKAPSTIADDKIRHFDAAVIQSAFPSDYFIRVT